MPEASAQADSSTCEFFASVPKRAYPAALRSAAARAIPPALAEQLVDGGRLVIPLGPPDVQELCGFVRRGEGLDRTELGAVRFVPLVGG